jgi:hypothetical protein
MYLFFWNEEVIYKTVVFYEHVSLNCNLPYPRSSAISLLFLDFVITKRITDLQIPIYLK